jgi:hypothetical protein
VTNLVLGVVMAAAGVIALASGASRVSAGPFAEGAFFLVLGWFNWAVVVRRPRTKVARARELNQPAAHRTA